MKWDLECICRTLSEKKYGLGTNSFTTYKSNGCIQPKEREVIIRVNHDDTVEEEVANSLLAAQDSPREVSIYCVDGPEGVTLCESSVSSHVLGQIGGRVKSINVVTRPKTEFAEPGHTEFRYDRYRSQLCMESLF
jgi:hypothetical protein